MRALNEGTSTRIRVSSNSLLDLETSFVSDWDVDLDLEVEEASVSAGDEMIIANSRSWAASFTKSPMSVESDHWMSFVDVWCGMERKLMLVLGDELGGSDAVISLDTWERGCEG